MPSNVEKRRGQVLLQHRIRDSSVGKMSGYGLENWDLNSGRSSDFYLDPAQSSSIANGYRKLFQGRNSGPVTMTTHLHRVPRVRLRGALHSLSPCREETLILVPTFSWTTWGKALSQQLPATIELSKPNFCMWQPKKDTALCHRHSK